MTHRIVTATHHAQQTVAIRTVVPMSELDISALCDDYLTRLSSYLEERSFPPSGPFYARYHAFGPTHCDIEIGLPTEADVTDLDELAANEVIGVSELPGGSVLELVHEGPYDRLVEAYQSLEGYVSTHALLTSGAPWESYLVMADMVDDDPEKLQTLVCWPV